MFTEGGFTVPANIQGQFDQAYNSPINRNLDAPEFAPTLTPTPTVEVGASTVTAPWPRADSPVHHGAATTRKPLGSAAFAHMG